MTSWQVTMPDWCVKTACVVYAQAQWEAKYSFVQLWKLLIPDSLHSKRNVYKYTLTKYGNVQTPKPQNNNEHVDLFNEELGMYFSGRELSFVLLFGILFCYGMTFILIMKPTDYWCAVQKFGIGFCFSICYSALLTKTNRIARIFRYACMTALCFTHSQKKGIKVSHHRSTKGAEKQYSACTKVFLWFREA